MRDLARQPDHAVVRADLEQRLRALQATFHDNLPWTAATLDPATVDLSGKRWPPDRSQPPWTVQKYFSK